MPALLQAENDNEYQLDQDLEKLMSDPQDQELKSPKHQLRPKDCEHGTSNITQATLLSQLG